MEDRSAINYPGICIASSDHRFLQLFSYALLGISKHPALGLIAPNTFTLDEQLLCDSLNIPRCLCLLAHNPSIRYHSKYRWKRPLQASLLYRRSTRPIRLGNNSSSLLTTRQPTLSSSRINKEIVAVMLGPLIALVKLRKAWLTAQSVSAPRSNGLMGEALSPM